jgi:hypothetical protein
MGKWTEDSAIDPCELHILAELRVNRSPRLRKYKAIIMLYEGDDHFRWVATATVREIESWAKQIKEASDA